MKKFSTFLIVFFAMQNFAFAQNGWQIQQSGVNLNLKSVCFVNSNTGWVTGDSGVILKTTNGGQNWIRQISNTNKALSHIVFTNSQNGTAAGSSYEYNPWCFERLVVLATSNGGDTWNIIFDQLSSMLHDVNSISGDIYAAYEGRDIQCLESTGFITKSLNGGFNWYYSLGNQFGYKSVSFINTLTGWASGEYTTDFGLRIKQLIKTTDAGLSWFIIRSDTNFYNQDFRMRFYNQSIGYKISNSLLKTTDGGFNWALTDTIMTAGVRTFTFINTDTGWCAGTGGNLIRTNDGGTSWSMQTSNTNQTLNSIFFINKDTGYIAGTGGTILKTISGGLTSANGFTENIPASIELYQNYPNPFNPVTKIKYKLSFSRQDGQIESNITLNVYDNLGKEVITLVNQRQSATDGSGVYEVEFDGSKLPSGTYFYRLTAGNFSETKRMILIK